MEMKTYEIDMLALLQYLYQLVELMLGDSELVLIESCGHVLVCVGVDVRIDSDRNIGFQTMHMRHLVDDIYLLK